MQFHCIIGKHKQATDSEQEGGSQTATPHFFRSKMQPGDRYSRYDLQPRFLQAI
jgi:hypothetical protein